MGKLNVKFELREGREFGEPDRISLEILGQVFVESFQPDKNYVKYVGTPEWNRVRAKFFGRKLQEIGLMIQNQAEKGKPESILVNKGTSLEHTIKLL